MVIRKFDRESDIRLMSVLNYKKAWSGSLFDGIPVVDGMEGCD